MKDTRTATRAVTQAVVSEVGVERAILGELAQSPHDDHQEPEKRRVPLDVALRFPSTEGPPRIPGSAVSEMKGREGKASWKPRKEAASRRKEWLSMSNGSDRGAGRGGPAPGEGSQPVCRG